MNDKLHSSVQTLLKDITTPTEDRPVQMPVSSEPSQPATPPPAEPATGSAAAAPVVTPETVKQEEPKPEMTAEALASTADLVIGMFDFSQHNLFRALGNRKKKGKLGRLYGDNATDRLELLINKVEAMHSQQSTATVIEAFTPDDIGMLRLHKAAEEYLEGLPLTDYEKEALKKPLIELLKKRGGNIPPEIALLLAVLQISGARATELFML